MAKTAFGAKIKAGMKAGKSPQQAFKAALKAKRSKVKRKK
jgi:hypothetical protein